MIQVLPAFSQKLIIQLTLLASLRVRCHRSMSWLEIPGHNPIPPSLTPKKGFWYLLGCPASKGAQRKLLRYSLRYQAAQGRGWGGVGGVTPWKIGWGCAAHFPKSLPYLWPKSAIFPTLFMTWPKIQHPIYDLGQVVRKLVNDNPGLNVSCFWPALL